MKVILSLSEAANLATPEVRNRMGVSDVTVEIGTSPVVNPTLDSQLTLNSPMPVAAVRALLSGNIIGAIKEVRIYFNSGLKEAKDYVDQFPRL